MLVTEDRTVDLMYNVKPALKDITNHCL